MFRSLLTTRKFISNVTRCSFSSQQVTIGFIGLGHMGSKMVQNLAQDGHHVVVYDRSSQAVQKVVSANSSKVQEGSIADISQKCSVIFSMLPNDEIVESVSNELLKTYSSKGDQTDRLKSFQNYHL